MKVYLAAPYVHKEQIKVYAARLRELGIDVTSSWLEEPHSPTTQVNELSHEENQRYAQQDIFDVLCADLLVFFTDPTKSIVRGGRHVEFGVAVGLNEATSAPMPIFVVGADYENIFHHLPYVRHFDHWELALDAICLYRYSDAMTGPKSR